VAEYTRFVAIVVPAEIPPDVVRDSKDRAVLACAVGGKADYIVSGDEDLLVLSIYENIPILNANQFVDRLS
jgi:predicted nucleic acid-binding protein